MDLVARHVSTAHQAPVKQGRQHERQDRDAESPEKINDLIESVMRQQLVEARREATHQAKARNRHCSGGGKDHENQSMRTTNCVRHRDTGGSRGGIALIAIYLHVYMVRETISHAQRRSRSSPIVHDGSFDHFRGGKHDHGIRHDAYLGPTSQRKRKRCEGAGRSTHHHHGYAHNRSDDRILRQILQDIRVDSRGSIGV